MRTKSESASAGKFYCEYADFFHKVPILISRNFFYYAEDNFERTPHKSTPGLTKQDATEIKSEDENEEENYDEFDVLTDIHTDSR